MSNPYGCTCKGTMHEHGCFVNRITGDAPVDDGLTRLRSELVERIEAVERRAESADLHSRQNKGNVACHEQEIGRLTDRVVALEKAIQDTRVAQGELGLVSEQQERNILGRIETVEANVASHEQEISMTNEDVAMYSHRIKAVEKVVHSLYAMEAGIGRKFDELTGRVKALEQEAAATTENEQLTIERLDALEEAAHERADPIGKALADGHEDGYKRGRAETAREVVEWLRSGNRAANPCCRTAAHEIEDKFPG